MDITDIIKSIKMGIDSLEYKYKERPNKIILGTEIITRLTNEILFIPHDHTDEPNTVLGIPIEPDYENPQRMAICMEWDVFPTVFPKEDV